MVVVVVMMMMMIDRSIDRSIIIIIIIIITIIILGFISGDHHLSNVVSVHEGRHLTCYASLLVGFGLIGSMMHDCEKFRWMGPSRYNGECKIYIFTGISPFPTMFSGDNFLKVDKRGFVQ